MYVEIVSKDQLAIGSLVRDKATQKEILEIESYNPDEDYYELSVAGSVLPQTGGKDDSLSFASSFENLTANYEVEIVNRGFRDEGKE